MGALCLGLNGALDSVITGQLTHQATCRVEKHPGYFRYLLHECVSLYFAILIKKNAYIILVSHLVSFHFKHHIFTKNQSKGELILVKILVNV